MGRRSSTSSFIMNSKACLLVFGFLLVFVILACAGEENNDNSLSEEIESSRVVRDADAGKGKKRKDRRKGKKGKKGKKRNMKKIKGGKNRKERRRNNKQVKKSGRRNKKRPVRKNSQFKKKTRSQGRTVHGKCLESAVKSMRKLEKVVANFDKQMIRVEKRLKSPPRRATRRQCSAPPPSS